MSTPKGGVVYILASTPNGTPYVGVTSDIVRRIHQPRRGLRRRRPVRRDPARSPRTLRRHRGGHPPREATEGVDTRLETGTHPRQQSAGARPVRGGLSDTRLVADPRTNRCAGPLGPVGDRGGRDGVVIWPGRRSVVEPPRSGALGEASSDRAIGPGVENVPWLFYINCDMAENCNPPMPCSPLFGQRVSPHG